MAEKDFFAADAKAKFSAAVEALEAQTSAEIVVAVRKQSGHYRHTDYAWGMFFAFVILLILLFHPYEFDIAFMPLEIVVGFAVGAFVSANLWSMRRALTSRKILDESVRRAARAAFVELGISRTSGRTGVLVYLSMFEQRVEMVPDVGIDASKLGSALGEASNEMTLALREADLERSITALRALGPALSPVLPHSSDDVNELPDTVNAS